jgi:hypothetical protein
MPARAIATIMSPTHHGMGVQFMQDLMCVSNAELQAAGVQKGPQDKIAAYQATVRSKQLQAAELVQAGSYKQDSSTGGGDVEEGATGETHSTSAPRISLSPPTSSSRQDSPVLLCSKDGLVDVLITHGWPSGIAYTFERTDERCRVLGNEPCQWLLDELQPTLMLCGHMHTAHRAVMEPSAVRCLAKVPASGSISFLKSC